MNAGLGKRIAIGLALLPILFCFGCGTDSDGFLNSVTDFSALKAEKGAEQAVRAELAAIEAQMSVSVSGSDLDRINRAAAGETVAIGAHTEAVLSFCLSAEEQFGGALFSPALLPLSELWGFAGEGGYRVPGREEIDPLLQTVSLSGVRLSDSAVTKSSEGLKLDFGGVAKGYALDCSLAKLQAYHATSGILNVGNSLLLIGTKSGGDRYRIGIADPRREEHGVPYAAVVLLSDCFVSTSSDAERYFVSDGVRYCHILDPETGAPAESDLLSVTVCFPCGAQDGGMRSDYWSTALFVAGRDLAGELCRTLERETEGFGYFLLAKDGTYLTNLETASSPSVFAGYQPE